MVGIRFLISQGGLPSGSGEYYPSTPAALPLSLNSVGFTEGPSHTVQVVKGYLGWAPRVLGVVPRVLGVGPQGTRGWPPGY